MIATNKIIEIINSYSKELESSGILSRAIVSNSQLIGAIKSYARGVNPDAIIAMFDNTLSCNGEEGIVLTTSAIYFSVIDVPGMSVKCAMLRYADIINASISTEKKSDFSCVAQIDIKNLPYEYYRVTSKTIKKHPFISILNEIRNLVNQGYEFENDHKASIYNVRNYLYERDVYMKKIYNRLLNGEGLYDVKCWMIDSMGLTPMHYCIAFNDKDNAYRIMSKTMKRNVDVYLKNQPFGIYNYCMNLAMAGITDDNTPLFAELYRYTDKLKLLEKKRKIASAKETTKKVAKFIWDSLMEAAQEAAMQEENNKSNYVYGKIDEQEERVKKLRNQVNKDPMLYRKWMQEQERLDRMKKKADDMFGTSDDSYDYEDSYEEEFDDNYEEEFEDETSYDCDDSADDSTYEVAEDDYSSLVTVEEIEQFIVNTIYEHIDNCKMALEDLKEAYNESKEVDPRFPIINDMMADKDKIGLRLNSNLDDLSLICIKFKYFYVQKSIFDLYPSLKEFEVKGET